MTKQSELLLERVVKYSAQGMRPKQIARECHISIPYVYILLDKAKSEVAQAEHEKLKRRSANVIQMYQTLTNPTYEMVESIAEDQELSIADVRDVLTEAGFDVPFPEAIEERKGPSKAEMEAAITAGIEQGLSVGEISAQTGYTTSKIYQVMRDLKIKPKSRHKERVARAAALYNEGKTVYEVAQAMGTLMSNVYPLLHEAGVTLRTTRSRGMSDAVAEIEEMWPDEK